MPASTWWLTKPSTMGSDALLWREGVHADRLLIHIKEIFKEVIIKQREIEEDTKCSSSVYTHVHGHINTQTQKAQVAQDLDVGRENTGSVSSMEGVVTCCWSRICDRLNLKEGGSTLAHGFRGFGPWALSPLSLARAPRRWSLW